MTKKLFSAFCYLMLLLVRETTCSMRQQKLTEFGAKLREMAPSTSLQPHSSDTKVVRLTVTPYFHTYISSKTHSHTKVVSLSSSRSRGL